MNKRVRLIAMKLHLSLVGALALMGGLPPGAVAQEDHSHNEAKQQELTPEQLSRRSALIKAVQNHTDRFHDVYQAMREGYALQFGCVSGPDQGAMGLHYVNMDLVGKGIVDVKKPQIVIYEQGQDGKLHLTGADFLVMAEQWDKTHDGPPELMGQLFHYFEFPNRFGLPAFYTLHVWAWKDNPNGAFVNWHPNVSCQNFVGPTTP